MKSPDILQTISDITGIKKKVDEILLGILNHDNFKQDRLLIWLKEKKQKWLKFLLGIALMLSVGNGFYLYNSKIFTIDIGNEAFVDIYQYLVICAHLIVIISVITSIVLHPYHSKYKETKKLEIASASTINFLNFWLYLWVSWFFLYLLRLIKEFYIYEQIKPLLPLFSNLCNNLTGVFLFAMFYEMYEKTVVVDASQRGNRTGILGIMLLSILFIIQLAFPVTAINKFIFSTLSGIFVGICTMLVVTRFSSIIFKIPFWALSAMTIYAVIQPIYPFFEGNVKIGGYEINSDKAFVILSSLALYGKIIFLIVINWSEKTDRIFYYLLRAGNLYRQENEENLRNKIMMCIKENMKKKINP